MNKKTLSLQATWDIMPLALACTPWASLTGSLALEAGLSPFQAQLMSLLVFAGAAQVAGLNMLQATSPTLSILSTTFIISSRHLLYSATFRDFARNLPRGKRYLLAFLLTDEMFAVSEEYRNKNGQLEFLYAASAGFVFYIVWNLATFTGILIGSSLGSMKEMGFEFAIAALFIAMVVPTIKTISTLIAVITSAATAVTAELYAISNAVLLAGISGMFSAFFVDKLNNKRVSK